MSAATICPECRGAKQILARVPGRYGEWIDCPTCDRRGVVEPPMSLCVCGAAHERGTRPCHADTLTWDDATWYIAEARDDGSHWHLTIVARVGEQPNR